MVQWGGLVVGDWSASYPNDASCTLINTTVTVIDDIELPVVYLSQDGSNTTTFNFDSQSKFYFGTEVVNYKINSVIEDSSQKQSGCTLNGGTIVVNGTTLYSQN